ncbi:mRNA interferase NdoA [Clostridium pasteurianum DSM 525 = ATCC 6013]|uniref:Transcriptional modulator of MazE/toxin, MazF n=1 Tax=Clostridium pasteurianum DSM 525 = ATCC 6013 TaxID=1262449 RepID=A0A0H3J7I6_CLOPA|nr:mRNA interferase NdoA [Clostridium pasteurianum DSM 525 = ATCC 6013]AOZ80136.1 hypothetical protein AQ984_14975 [Clostridium pasteurianum]AJA53140.1 mRNA interferase NdoA [Clostridium pasteurianum DSM 525 = ATCC 6013]AOZ76339.1 hypothetical protein AQ983_14980 [Clostridium pasteurianum DSM 525 = ATCC 6013]ELP59086.1 PemK family DNA-binding protein [Clostridium pasteurianum DSM 525 = ATCC 6013]
MRNMFNRGDIFFADISPVIGNEICGKRPVIIIQNDAANEYSTEVIVAMITAKMSKMKISMHVELNCEDSRLNMNSTVLLEHTPLYNKIN